MAIQYYSSNDNGAPQLTVTRNVHNDYQNSIDLIMDAILVTGYGDKPACGWEKVMRSEVEGSNRTVYKNKSANQDSMFLLVESGKQNSTTIRMQIADIVTTPEQYAGYSNVAESTQTHSGAQYWFAAGDERTIIFVTWSNYVENSWWGGAYGPYAFYVGDFDLLGETNAKGWGLLGSVMKQGRLDDITSADTGYGCFGMQTINYNCRPFTQIPEQPWAETGLVINFASQGQDPMSRIFDPEIFTAQVRLRSPWYLWFGDNHIYRLRGVYNFYPWLGGRDSSHFNILKPLSIHGEQYIPLPHIQNHSSNAGLGVYIQTSGEW